MAGPLTTAAQLAKKETEASLAEVVALLREYVASSNVGIVDATLNRTGAILQGVALRSPIDQGYFRAAWNQGFRALGAQAPPLPARPGIDPAAVTAGDRAGIATIDETDDGVEITIVNPARYGPFLEAGASKQARGGIIRPVFDEQKRALRTAIERVRPGGVK